MLQGFLLQEAYGSRRIAGWRIEATVAHQPRQNEEVATPFQNERGESVPQQVRREVDAAGISHSLDHSLECLVARSIYLRPCRRTGNGTPCHFS